MNKLYIVILGIALFLFNSGSLTAQGGKYTKADKEYDDLAYINASDIYLYVADKGYRSLELLQKLGNTFYFNAEYTEAAHWYGESFSLIGHTDSIQPEPIYYLRYAQSLHASGNRNEAREWFNKYTGLVPQKEQRTVAQYHKLMEKNSGRYIIQNLEVNTSAIDFGASFSGNKLLFASTRDTGTVTTRTSSWDNRTFLNLYEAPINENGSLGPVSKLKGILKSRFHESSATVTKDGNTMYFTRNNITSKEKNKKKETKNLKIYRAKRQGNGEWGDLEDLSINDKGFNTAHPALSPDGKKLYFVSDRKGSVGQTDIFVVEINENGSLGTPENLGPQVNTKGRESFPFVTERDELYFSSDGHYGHGGYDVFYMDLSGTMAGVPINVGKPVNSEKDDFAFAIDKEGKKGYFSSNRPGGQGNDDIYSFVQIKDIAETLKSRIYGKVVDVDTGEPLENAPITILNGKGDKIYMLKTDADGNYMADPTNIMLTYRVLSEKGEYDSDDAQVIAGNGENEVNFALKRNTYTLTEGLDLAKILNIPMIYFDFDGSDIRSDADVELQKALAVLQRYPALRIDIRSHTDSRGDDAYNRSLSERRARSTMEWLVRNGIDRSRLMAKGYGESQLVNHCPNGIPCSEEAHQQNRRSEFIVIK